MHLWIKHFPHKTHRGNLIESREYQLLRLWVPPGGRLLHRAHLNPRLYQDECHSQHFSRRKKSVVNSVIFRAAYDSMFLWFWWMQMIRDLIDLDIQTFYFWHPRRWRWKLKTYPWFRGDYELGKSSGSSLFPGCGLECRSYRSFKPFLAPKLGGFPTKHRNFRQAKISKPRGDWAEGFFFCRDVSFDEQWTKIQGCLGHIGDYTIKWGL